MQVLEKEIVVNEKKSTAIIESGNAKKGTRSLLLIVLSVFAIYLSIGIFLGVVPSFVKNELKFSNLIVGIVIGLEAASTLLTRAYSGKITDTIGANISSFRGIALMLVVGLFFMTVGGLTAFPHWALALLMTTVIIQGIAESFLITGALTWGIGLLGQQNSGKVMTWNGIAMYGGIAVGAPLGIFLSTKFGMTVAFAPIIMMAFVGWLCTKRLPVLLVDLSHVRLPFYKVLGKVKEQGLALALSTIAFACISSFIVLFFELKHWENASLAFAFFGGFYVLTRVFFATSIDKYGGYKVSMVSIAVEIAGQLMIAVAPSEAWAIAGCALTGIGFSMVFPALGVLAIRKISPQMRGTALGAYAVFFDISSGLSGPTAGLIAGWISYQAIYFFGAAGSILAILLLFINRNKR